MTGAGNNTWLLDGAEPTLIDAGVGASAHVEAIARALGGRPLARVLVTHGHADHASGVPALRARWPGVELAKFLPRTGRQSRGCVAARLPTAIGSRAGDSVLTVIHTPGHALDHVCFWDPDTRDLFAGDMLSLGTTIMIPAGRGGGLRAYLASLERLAALAPARIFPATARSSSSRWNSSPSTSHIGACAKSRSARVCATASRTRRDRRTASTRTWPPALAAAARGDDRGAPRETARGWAMMPRPLWITTCLLKTGFADSFWRS